VTGNPIDKLGSYRPRRIKGVDSIGKSLRKGRYSDELLQALHVAASSRPENLLQSFGYDIFAQEFSQPRKAPGLLWMGQPATIPDTDTRNAQAATVQMNAGAPAATSLSFWASAADMATLCDEQGRGTITNRAPMTAAYCGFPGFVLPYLQSQIVYLVPALQHMCNPFGQCKLLYAGSGLRASKYAYKNKIRATC
jgi:hypothetical protein